MIGWISGRGVRPWSFSGKVGAYGCSLLCTCVMKLISDLSPHPPPPQVTAMEMMVFSCRLDAIIRAYDVINADSYTVSC